MLKFLLGGAAAFALLGSSPALAGNCGDCKDCPHKKETAAQAQKPGAVAEADKKEQKGCGCDHAASKECKCGEKCACATCPVHAKKGEKTEKKS
jgi:hypothetical protein